MTLLKDENSGVKVELFRYQEPLSQVISSGGLVSVLNPVMKELINDRDWRVREKGLRAYDVYLTKLGEEYCSSEGVSEILKSLMADKVFIVRRRAIELVRDLCSQFGPKYTEKYGLDILNSFAGNPFYLYRLNYVFGLREMFPSLSRPALAKELETVMRMVKDQVPNVRYNALLLLLSVYSSGEDPTLEERIVKLAKQMESDNDSEVEKLVGRLSGGANFKANVKKILSVN